MEDPTSKAESVGYARELEVACAGLKEMHKRGIKILPGGDYGYAAASPVTMTQHKVADPLDLPGPPMEHTGTSSFLSIYLGSPQWKRFCRPQPWGARS